MYIYSYKQRTQFIYRNSSIAIDNPLQSRPANEVAGCRSKHLHVARWHKQTAWLSATTVQSTGPLNHKPYLASSTQPFQNHILIMCKLSEPSTSTFQKLPDFIKFWQVNLILLYRLQKYSSGHFISYTIRNQILSLVLFFIFYR